MLRMKPRHQLGSDHKRSFYSDQILLLMLGKPQKHVLFCSGDDRSNLRPEAKISSGEKNINGLIGHCHQQIWI